MVLLVYLRFQVPIFPWYPVPKKIMEFSPAPAQQLLSRLGIPYSSTCTRRRARARHKQKNTPDAWMDRVWWDPSELCTLLNFAFYNMN